MTTPFGHVFEPQHLYEFRGTDGKAESRVRTTRTLELNWINPKNEEVISEEVLRELVNNNGKIMERWKALKPFNRERPEDLNWCGELTENQQEDP